MTNLIFDLNNMAHRSMFAVGGFGSKQYTFDSQSEIDQLMRKMTMDIAFLIRIVNPSRVILALDAKSWRKSIVIDENDGYKAQREKTKTINWNNVYEALTEFTELMQNNGMIVTKIETAEADDVIALWSHELCYKHDEHVIIVSGDEDLRQLVNYWPYDKPNNKVAFITVFNPFMQGKNASRKLYVSKYFESWINEPDVVDFLNMRGTVNIEKDDYKKILSTDKIRMEVVDGRMIALRKIFCGDDGDNIPAIYSWLNDKGVEVRVTNSKFEKMYQQLLVSPNESLDHIDILERAEDVKNILSKVIKQPIPFDMYSRLERQIKLVVLDQKFFPQEIVEAFNEIKEYEFNKPKVNYAGANMKDLLEGTRYVRENKKQNESGIFKQIDRIQGSSLF